MLENGATPLIDATNAKIRNPGYDCSRLRDPGVSYTRLAPDEPNTVDWSQYDGPVSSGSANDFNGAVVTSAYTVPVVYSNPRPAPTPTWSSTNSNGNNNVYVPPKPSPAASTFSTTSTSSTEDCPPGFTGYFPTAQCTRYVYCQNGSVVGASQPCSPGTLFDVTKHTCAFAGTVSCGK